MQYSTNTILSLTDNTDILSYQTDFVEKKSHFQIRRIFIFSIIAITDMVVFFQRACPTVVTEELAEAYHVKVSQLGIFSSMFYYPYALLQPFAGLLADVMEPSFLIGCSNIISAIGAVICGLSKTLFIGCIGRVIVGVGCSLIYASCQRIIMNWFPLEYYSKMMGLFLFIAGCGNFLAQTPFTLLSELIGWRWCFYSIACFSVFLSLIIIFFIRGNPISHGYPPVNESLSKNIAELSVREKIKHLLNNLKTIIINPSYWIFSIFVFFTNGSFYNITGIWGGPYFKEVLGYNSVKASNALLGLSIGSILGPVINSYIPEVFCHHRKLVICIETVIAIICCIPFAFFPEKLNFGAVISLLVLFSLTIHTGTISIPYCLEFFHPSAGSSVIGCLNCFAFISLIVLMPLTGKILQHFGTLPEKPDLHNPDGFKFGLWIFNICGLGIGLILILFVRKPIIPQDSLNEALNYDPMK